MTHVGGQRLDWLATEERRNAVPAALGADEVFHYSIPVFDEIGDGCLEDPQDIGSAKLVLSGGEVLVSKLNPRIPRVLRAVSHDVPTVASTEFIALRPGPNVDERFLRYWLSSDQVHQYLDGATMSVTRSQQRVRPEVLTKMRVTFPVLREQAAIADFLDTAITGIDALISKKQLLMDRLDERIDAMVSATIGESGLAEPNRPAVEVRRLLAKLRRPATSGPIVTAFRDGQVTARALRRAEGYTEAWTEKATFQEVRRGDVVVHGLDGFAGAVGTCEADGVCSPVYHVMTPIDGGDSDFYGRLLHRLAKTGYLSLFAVSTRERAVDFRNWDLFGRIPIPAVSVDRQREIGGRIRGLRPARSAVERSRGLALERRQALITAAVAGELEIPGVA